MTENLKHKRDYITLAKEDDGRFRYVATFLVGSSEQAAKAAAKHDGDNPAAEYIAVPTRSWGRYGAALIEFEPQLKVTDLGEGIGLTAPTAQEAPETANDAADVTTVEEQSSLAAVV